MWKAAKAALRVKLLALNAHITKEENFQIYMNKFENAGEKKSKINSSRQKIGSKNLFLKSRKQ